MNRSRIIRYDDAGIFYEKMAIDSIQKRCQTNGTFSFFGRIKMDDCQVIPGGALLGPPIAPMAQEEEAAAHKRVAAALERIAARKQPEQKSAPGIERVAALLRAAPSAVRSAWILGRGFVKIQFSSAGWTAHDEDCTHFTDYPPGWYLGKIWAYDTVFGKREEVLWTLICGSDGGPPGKTHHWDILESH